MGLATVSLFLARGAHVCALDLSTETPEIKKLQSQYGTQRLSVRKADVTNQSQIKQILTDLWNQWGEVSGVVNCAGVLSAGKVVSSNPNTLLSPENMMRTLRINVVGTFTVCQQYCQLARARKLKSGVIVNVASVAGEDGQQGQTAYSASKGAIMAMTLPMSRELGRMGVRVVAVMPGLFRTKMSDLIPSRVEKAILANSALKRFGEPEEFADFVAAIVGNSYLTGVNLRLDGGTKLPML